MSIELYDKSIKAFDTTTAAKGDVVAVRRGAEDFKNALINSISDASLVLVDANAGKSSVTPGQIDSGAVTIDGAVDNGSAAPDDIAVFSGSGAYDAGDFTINLSSSTGGAAVSYSPATSHDQSVYVIGAPSAGRHDTYGATGAFQIYNTTGSVNNVSTLITVDAATGKKTALTLGLYSDGGGGIPYLTVIKR
jgi:hypothetical protein